MNDKITLKFQKLRVGTALGWALILLLALLSRGVLSSFAFWLILSLVLLLFVLDAVYFVTRVIEGHYLVVTNRHVIMKRFLKPVESIVISELTSITFVNNGVYGKRIILSDGEKTIEIKHVYEIAKESIIAIIRESDNYPKNLVLTQK